VLWLVAESILLVCLFGFFSVSFEDKIINTIGSILPCPTSRYIIPKLLNNTGLCHHQNGGAGWRVGKHEECQGTRAQKIREHQIKFEFYLLNNFYGEICYARLDNRKFLLFSCLLFLLPSRLWDEGCREKYKKKVSGKLCLSELLDKFFDKYWLIITLDVMELTFRAEGKKEKAYEMRKSGLPFHNHPILQFVFAFVFTMTWKAWSSSSLTILTFQQQRCVTALYLPWDYRSQIVQDIVLLARWCHTWLWKMEKINWFFPPFIKRLWVVQKHSKIHRGPANTYMGDFESKQRFFFVVACDIENFKTWVNRSKICPNRHHFVKWFYRVLQSQITVEKCLNSS
jgi:hypothetical protein